MSSPLLNQVRMVARLKHMSLRTEESYVHTIKRFIVFHAKRHPLELGVDEIRAYLAHLAIEQQVSASTQNAALCALLFLYRHVLQIDLPRIEGIERAQQLAKVPTVFTEQEVQALLAELRGVNHLNSGSWLLKAEWSDSYFILHTSSF